MDTTQNTSSGNMTDLINATKGQALNTGALVRSNQDLVTSSNNQVTQTTNLVTQATNQVTQTTNLVTQATNQVTQLTNLVTQTTYLVTAVTNLTTAINNALALGPWSTWSPTISSGSGTITTVGTVIARYAQAGKNVYFSIVIPITTNGTGATSVRATLPTTAQSASVVAGRETQSGGKMLQGSISASSNTLVIFNYDNTYPGGSGFILVLSGLYETQ